MIKLLKTAVELQTLCERQGWQFCFIGGIAVQRWGQPRVTLDVDITLLTGFGDEDRFIEVLLAAYSSRAQNPAEFARRNRVLLLHAPDGTGIDISLGALPFEENVVRRATPFTFPERIDLRTCSAEDLVVMKLFASRAIDIRDAEMVAVRQNGRLDWRYIEEQLRPLAEAKEAPEIMDALARIRNL